MGLFTKAIPKACPKCGKADGWRCLPAEPVQNNVTGARAVNPFSPAPIRGSFGMNLAGNMGQSKRIRYHCDNCGFEKTF